MLIYSNVLTHNSELFLIQFLRENKWVWDHKFFFDDLNRRQTLVLLKSLFKKKNIFVSVEGVSGNPLKYWRPYNRAKFVFGHMDLPNAIFYNMFFDEMWKVKSAAFDYTSKIGSELIPKVCFISSNYAKIKNLQNSDPEIYSKMDIFGEYHKPIARTASPDRCADSLSTCAKYMAALCIENNEEEGYFQGSALWALYALTPPILKAPAKWKNFIRKEFVIDFFDYKMMSENQRMTAIRTVQERLYSGDAFHTTLSEDYESFFKESFSSSVEPNYASIIKESHIFRKHFCSV